MSFLKSFGLVLPLFLLLDLTWIGVVMKGFYDAELGVLVRRDGAALAPRWGAATLVYLLIPAGIVTFVSPHLNQSSSIMQAVGWGAVFGLVLYGVYDLTNLAVLDKWTWRVTIVDVLWGVTLCGTSAGWMHASTCWLDNGH